MQNSDFWIWITSLYDLSFCAFKTTWLAPELLVSIGPSPNCGFSMQNSDFWTWVTSLYGSKTWPVVVCMYNSVLSTRITSLYGSHPSSVVYACKSETFGPELQVSMCTRPHLSFCACKTAWLAPEWQVSMGLHPRLWLLIAKQCLFVQNYKSLWVPDHTCGFSMQNSHFWSRITSLYGSQTWPVILCMYNSVLNNRNTSLYRSPLSSVVFECKTASFGAEL